MGREHRVISALSRHRSRSRRWSGCARTRRVNGAPFYVMEFVEGPILRSRRPRRPSVPRGRAPRDRRAGGRHAGRDPRRRPRRGRPRRARQEGGLRRAPAQALARAVGEVEDARAPARRRRPRPPVGADPRPGAGDDRPRRLPPRQHDPRPGGRGRRGRRLGALHARRPARRRRAADGLLVGGGRRADPLFDPPTIAPGFPSREEVRDRYAERSAATSPSSTSTSRSATGSWRSSSRAIIARFAAGQYGKTDEGFEETAGSSSASPRRPTRPSGGWAELDAWQAPAQRLSGRGSAPAPFAPSSSRFATG